MANKKIDRLNELYIEGKITKEKYDNLFVQLTNNIVDTSETQYKPYKRSFNSDILSLYESMNRSQKRVFWAEIIDKIVIREDGMIDVSFR